MSTSTKRIPEGCHGVIPHPVVSDSNRAIEFYSHREDPTPAPIQERAKAADAAMGKPTA